MLQFQSLICFKGHDNANRFALIQLATYFSLLIVAALFSHIAIFYLLLIIALGAINTASSQRRIKDAQLENKWLVLPISIFAISAIIPMLIPHATSYLAMLLSIPSTLVLMSKASKGQHKYHFGYNGPVDLSTLAEQNQGSQYANRIEPTFVAGQDEHFITKEQATFDEQALNLSQQSTVDNEPQADPLATLKQLIEQKPKLVQGVSAIIALIVIVGITLPLWQSESEKVQSEPSQIQPQVIEKPKATRDHLIAMPNNEFYLLLDDNQSLIIHWPSYDQDTPEAWSILTATGEESCEQISFNNKLKVRSTIVSIENDGDYYASFSPLDTETLVTAIADQSKFSLCGYDFSLKGTRTTIAKSTTYSEFLR